MIVRVYYNPICYREVEVEDINIVKKTDFENFKNEIDKIKNNENNKVFVIDTFAAYL